MENSDQQCSAVYEPLNKRCMKQQHHDGPHACMHNDEDMHLWNDICGAQHDGAGREAAAEDPAAEPLEQAANCGNF